MKLGRLLALGLITSQVALATANAQTVPPKLSEMVVYGGNRIPTTRELTNIRMDKVRLKVEDNDWKTVLQETVQVNETGPGGPVSLFMRGSGSSQTMFMIDGMRISSATTGAPNFAAIAPGLLTSIDVLQGGASAAFGANAVGGVIRGSVDIPTGLTVSAGGGSRMSERAAVSAGARDDRFHYGFRVVQDIINQGSATNANNLWSYNPDADIRKRVGMVAKAGGMVTDNLQVELTGLYSGVRTMYDGSATTNDLNLQAIGMGNMRAIYHLPDNMRAIASYGIATDRSTLRGSTPMVINTQSLQGNVQLEKDMKIGRVFVGADHEIQKVSSTTHYTENQRTNVSGFVGAQLRAASMVAEGVYRHDENSQFGGYNTYNVSLARIFAENWRLGALASTSFRAPTFNDLYWPMAWGFGGNPGLTPERGTMQEVFMSYEKGETRYRVGAFINDIKDAIAINSIFSQMENISHAKIQGVEMSGAQPLLAGFSTRVNVTVQDPRNEQTGMVLARRSQVWGTAALRYESGPAMLEGIVRVEGHRFDDSMNTARLPTMAIVGLSSSYKLPAKGPTLRVQVDNLLDKEYQPAMGFRGIPRTVWASASFTF